MKVGTKPHASSEYLALLGAFPPRPIHDDDAHRRAIEVVNSLLDRPAPPRMKRIISTSWVYSSPTTRTRFSNIPNSLPSSGSATSWRSTP